MLVVAMVDSVYGSPCRMAERAAPDSPSGCSIRVYPTGASAKGTGTGRPKIDVEVSTPETSVRTRGRKRHCRKAATFARTVSSSSAAPST